MNTTFMPKSDEDNQKMFHLPELKTGFNLSHKRNSSFVPTQFQRKLHEQYAAVDNMNKNWKERATFSLSKQEEDVTLRRMM